ncbi:MAG: ribonuclease H-like domain-containing protein [Myxococcota bacterium]
MAGGWARDQLGRALEDAGFRGVRAVKVQEHVGRFDVHLAARDVHGLWSLLPVRQRWRMIPVLLDHAVFIDVETDGGRTPNAMTVLSVRTRDRAACWVRGQDPTPALQLVESASAVVTFAGAQLDLPLLKAAWPQLQMPTLHVDVAAVVRQLGVHGGLKVVEAQMGWTRAEHVRALRGPDAIPLWQRWTLERDRQALELLCEYAMEDVWSLPRLAAWVHDSLVGRIRAAVGGLPETLPACEAWQERAEGGPMMLKATLAAIRAAAETTPQT